MTGFERIGDEPRLFLFGGTYNPAWLRDLSYTQVSVLTDSRFVRLIKYAVGAASAIGKWKPDAVLCADVTTLQMARVGRYLSRRTMVPIASWIHVPLNIQRLKQHLHHADLHLAISARLARDLQEFLPAQRERVFTVYNAIDVEKAELVPRARTASFLYVGRFTVDGQKRVNDLLAAVSRLHGNWKLKLIGGPTKGSESDEARLKTMATQLGIDDRVEWLGWQTNPWKAAGETTALVMTSSHEGFGMVLVEANAHGIFCVSSDCESGPAEILEPGCNGWLFPVGDTERLTERLQSLVDAPENLPSQEEIQKTALRFSAPVVAQRAREGLIKAIAALRK